MPILLNWLWQGSALTCLVALVVCRRRRLNAATRERIWWATLGTVCLMPLISMVGVTPSAVLPIDATPLAIVVEPPAGLLRTAWLIWTLWLTIAVVRIGGALVALDRSKRSAEPFPSDRLAGLTAWRHVSTQGRRATLVVSDRVCTAAVLGLGRPLIAVSPDALAALNDEELDGVLVHEYGHVRRRDDLGVLLQRAVRAVFGLHPAAWWLDRALTFEREVACDDLVLAEAHSTPQRYARSLVKLVEHRGARGDLGLAPGAIFGRPQLTRRILRLLDCRRNASVTPSRSTLGFATSAIAGLALVALSVELIALSAPTLTSRRVAAAVVEPFASARVAPNLSFAWTMGEAAGRAPHAPPAAPVAPAGVDGPFLSGLEPGAVVTAAAASESSAGGLLPSETIAVTVLLPVSNPTSPGVSGRSSGATGSGAGADSPAGAPKMWTQAAGAASAIGRGSREGAVKTAGVFTRIGKSVAGAF